MRHIFRTLAVSAAAALLAAAPAAAQSGNLSNITFPNITGSGPNGGSFLGAGLRTVNEMFAVGRNDAVEFRNGRVGCAARGAARAYRDSVAQVPRSQAQARVDALLIGSTGPEAVAAALSHGADAGSPLGRLSRALADALNGMLRPREGCGGAVGDYPEAEQWERAIRAFNDYVKGAPDQAFSPPAPELLAVHQALNFVVEHTLAGR
jgi:hypothetical protein